MIGSRWARRHIAVDLSTPCGTAVPAATAGTVQINTAQAWAGPHPVKIASGQKVGHVGPLGNASGCQRKSGVSLR